MFYKKFDEFKGRSWYRHNFFFSYGEKPFELYVGELSDDYITSSRKKVEDHLKDVKDPKKIEEYQVKLKEATPSGKYLRLQFEYNSSSWIFFDNGTIINQNGDKMEWSMKSYDKKTDVHSGGMVYESYDVKLSESEAKELYDLLTITGVCKFRLSGKYYKDYVIGAEYKTV